MQTKSSSAARIENTSLLYDLSTDAFARLNQVKPASVVARICRTGSYFGIVPVKLANGRLAFPAVQVTRDAQAAVPKAA